MTVKTTQSRTASTRRREARAVLVRARVPAAVIGIVVPGALAAGFGVPSRPWVLLWIVALAALVTLDNPHPAARFVRDWLPMLVILVGYDLVRTQAPHLTERAVTEPQLRFDEIVFGGEVPTVTLQRALVDGGTPHWWDYGVWAFYLSHFVMTIALAAYLYRVSWARFKRFSTLILTVSLAGFATYLILPAVPPWLASREGALPATTRIVHDVWQALGLDGAAKVFAGDAKFANPVAALPSLHAAWPFMAILFFWSTARRGRWVLVAYMTVMTFVLVYGSEHYVSDILLGWVYAAVVFVTWRRIWGRRDARGGTERGTSPLSPLAPLAAPSAGSG